MEILSVTFNEGLSDITFVSLHPFLRRPQILLTVIIHLTLIKSNLSEKKLAFSFEKSLNNSILLVLIANCSDYLHMLTLSHVDLFIAIIMEIVFCSYCWKLFVIKDFLLTYSSVV